MTDTAVLYRVEDGVAVLTLNRPDARNAVTQEMMRDLRRALAEANADDAVRAVALHGNGPCFSAGFDIKEQIENRPTGAEAWDGILRNEFETVMGFWRSRKPTVSAVHGACFGGSLQLATACDLTIASEETRFAEPELQFGATVVALTLPWLVAPKIAKEIILTGEANLSARRAYEIGLVNRITPTGAALDEALSVARRIAAMDPGLVQRTKGAINLAFEAAAMSDALEQALAIDLEIEAVGSPDKLRFLEIARTQGLKAAFAWRDSRFARDGD
ncbi:enoyl-CoA hydratase/isomerase family protein [Methylopila musalis]|uniref:Enoyl-CoA hydratase/isomerase family protein n=1 Tax=Methylopila musalis TaxID=1134781 RepID=A0ABW3Z3C4_9HYPH